LITLRIGHAVANTKVDVSCVIQVFSSVLAECIVFMLLFLLHVLGYFDFFV